MIDSKEKFAKRDGRLSTAIFSFAISAGSLSFEGWILFVYVRSALNQNWSYFERLFPSAVPQVPAGFNCYDDCSPDLPFLPGWIGIVAFIVGLVTLLRAWWVPRRPERIAMSSTTTTTT